MSKQEQLSSVHLPWFGIPRIARYFKPYRGMIAVMFACVLMNGLMDIILPLFQQYAIDVFVLGNTTQGIVPFTILYAALIVTEALLIRASIYRASKLEMDVGRDMKRDAFQHLQTLSFSYFNTNSVGYIHARVMSDTGRIGSTLCWGMFDGVWNVTYVIGCVISMFCLNAQLALWVVVIIPFVALISAFFQRRLVIGNRRIREANSKITGGFNEGITGAKTTKTLVVEQRMDEDFHRLTDEMRSVSVRTARYRALFVSLVIFASAIALAMVLWKGGDIAQNAPLIMQIGTLSVFMTYATGLMEPVQWLARVISDLIAVQVNIERVTNLLATESDVKDTPEVIEKYGDCFHPKKENWEPLAGRVTFDDVTFRYPDGDVNVLEHFNLEVPEGSNVAIVGETGAGKSTIVNLVCRFFEPTSGRILIDGVDARERSQLWLHQNIGYVLQTPHLFSGTVLENLRYGKPDATMEEIDKAVKTVCADRVIEKLKQGYDTDVGEGGDLLSTGEKQLISFARAILCDPRIAILDEATSSIDTLTERWIQEAIDQLMEGRTSFVIAHRLSTIRKADVILVVDDGKIVERGSHAELMKKRGFYYNLYTRQFEKESLQQQG